MDPDGTSLLFLITLNWGWIGEGGLLIFLLGCSAFVSGSEVAFFSLNSNQMSELEAEGSASAKRIISLRDKPRRLLATILITNNLINVGIVIIAYSLFKTMLPQSVLYTWGIHTSDLHLLGWLDPYQWAALYNFLITITIVTFLLILFGEILPKIYANLNNIAYARRMSGPVSVLMSVFAPVNRTMVKWGQVLEKRLGADHSLGATKVDIDRAIDLAVAHDTDSKVEAEILKSIVSFNDVAVKQIMRSRMDIIALDTTLDAREMITTVRESGYSRLPVYEEQLDNIKGILYVKDLIGYMDAESENGSWVDLVRPELLYVPEARKINDLLKDFQREHLHMAIVVDEYGGTSGIVTMEDVIEEVIGEIQDEFDEDQELEYRRLSEKEYIFEGRTMLFDVSRIMNIDRSSFDEADGDADSLAGLILDLHGRMPVVGQKIVFPPFSFTVLSVSPKRIERIKVQIE